MSSLLTVHYINNVKAECINQLNSVADEDWIPVIPGIYINGHFSNMIASKSIIDNWIDMFFGKTQLLMASGFGVLFNNRWSIGGIIAGGFLGLIFYFVFSLLILVIALPIGVLLDLFYFLPVFVRNFLIISRYDIHDERSELILSNIKLIDQLFEKAK